MGIKDQTLSPRVVRDLKKRALAGPYIYLITVGVVLYGEGYYLRYPFFSAQFLLLVLGICLIRFVHNLVDARLPDRFESLSLWFFLASLLITALIWGIGFAKFMAQPGEIDSQLLMVVCTIGLCGGGVLAYNPYLWLCVGYNLLILGPGILFMLGTGVNPPLCILVVIFSSYMVVMGLRANTEYRTALENELLLEKKTRDLEKISQMDGLTGLYNRRYFNTALDMEWSRALRHQTRLGLLICDIDYFKRVNDDYGHLAGDEYLKGMARILQSVFRRGTDIIARYGGEEFVVVMTDDPWGSLSDLADIFREKMEKTRFEFDGDTIGATVSIGLAVTTPKVDEDNENLIAMADSMLYKAKSMGRNQVRTIEG